MGPPLLGLQSFVSTLLCGLQPLSAPSYLRQEGEEQMEPRVGTWQQDVAATR